MIKINDKQHVVPICIIFTIDFTMVNTLAIKIIIIIIHIGNSIELDISE